MTEPQVIELWLCGYSHDAQRRIAASAPQRSCAISTPGAARSTRSTPCDAHASTLCAELRASIEGAVIDRCRISIGARHRMTSLTDGAP
jgi:hypothetical protein